MERMEVNGVELEYDIHGSGEPVVLLHGGLLADENTPLSKETALTERFRVINYHRRGFAGSTHPEPKAWMGLEDQAADCHALMQALGVPRAHFVGHSLGGAIGIQVALDYPDSVHTLSLMEPAIMGAIVKAELANNPEFAKNQQEFVESMDKVAEIYERGDRRGALEAFLNTRAGDFFRGVLDFLLEQGEFEQAVKDADTFIEVEMPAAFAWEFTRAEAARITQPVLSLLGAHSPERAQKVHQVLKDWVPQTELRLLAGADHALPLMDPPGIAGVLAGFLIEHPIKVSA